MKSTVFTPELNKKIIWLVIFSIAMAFLETAVVVYLRDMYYPDGFGFPLRPISSMIAKVEFWREIATIIMLVGIGIATGKTAAQRFAFFLLSFAIWDIFYYVFLYVILGWPSSLFTWDILFLVPVPWFGPVIAPVIISCFMIVYAFVIVYFNSLFNWKEWTLSILGSAVVILSWTLDYLLFSSNYTTADALTLSTHKGKFALLAALNYIPTDYDWYIFLIGIGLLVLALFLFVWRNMKKY